MTEPDYYASNGLSPLKAFEQGLISKEEYIGFCKGNVIKYTVRAGKKDDALLDIVKAMDYLMYLHKVLKDNEEKEYSYNMPVNGSKKEFSTNSSKDKLVKAFEFLNKIKQ